MRNKAKRPFAYEGIQQYWCRWCGKNLRNLFGPPYCSILCAANDARDAHKTGDANREAEAVAARVALRKVDGRHGFQAHDGEQPASPRLIKALGL